MLIHWIWFSQLSQLNSHQKLLLLTRFRDPEEIYYTQPEVLGQMEGMTQEAATALEERDLSKAQGILRRCMEKNISILTFGDAAYPSRLKNIDDPPMVLYYIGTLPDWEALPVIGAVGTRKASAYGMHMARTLCAQIVSCGALLASGGAEGIDTMSMLGALDAGGRVIGVLAGGLDKPYPVCNKTMFAQTARQGCLLSEYPPGTPSYKWNFPARNRIISGISNGVLVVEAPEISGALITARRAAEQGREIFVVPANADVASSAGSNQLLRQQAIPVWDGWDVVREYEALYPGRLHKAKNAPFSGEKVAETPVIPQKQTKESAKPPKKTIDNGKKSSYSVLDDRDLDPEERTVLGCLTQEPQNVDEVIAQTGLSSGRVLSILTKLTLKGKVKNHPGKRVSLL